MSSISFREWLKQDLQAQGYVGEDLEGKLHSCLSLVPKSLQILAEEAQFRHAAKLPFQLYITSLRDKDEKVQEKRRMLERFLKEGKQEHVSRSNEQ